MATSSAPRSTDDLAKLLLRVVLGLLILCHGIAKLKGGPGFVLDVVSKAGLPPAVGYLVYVGEVVAPLLLVIGLFTRAAALVVAINMIFAVFRHRDDLEKTACGCGFIANVRSGRRRARGFSACTARRIRARPCSTCRFPRATTR